MMKLAVIAAAPFIGALAFRVRGGLFNVGSSTVGRLIWSAAMAAVAVLASGDVRAAALGIGFFVAATVPQFQAIDMGRVEGTLKRDAAMMLLRGLIWTGVPAVMLFGAGHSWKAAALLGAGVLCPVIYEAGWRIKSSIKGAAQGSELAEWIFGAWYALALAAILAA